MAVPDLTPSGDQIFSPVFREPSDDLFVTAGPATREPLYVQDLRAEVAYLERRVVVLRGLLASTLERLHEQHRASEWLRGACRGR